MVTTTFCLSGAVLLKAGEGVNTSLADQFVGSDLYIDLLIVEAESLINVLTRYNWTDVYTSGLNADVKYILHELASDLAAVYAIMYDMSGYSTRTEAENMVNILRDAALRGLGILRDKKQQDFISGA